MLQNDTIRLKVYFKDFNNKSVDPLNITLTIYNSNKEVLEIIQLTENNKSSIGVYFYDYTPKELGDFIFEFKGTHDEKIILVRDKVKVEFY